MLFRSLEALKAAGADVVDLVAVIERGKGVERLKSHGYTIKTMLRVDADERGVRILE